MKGDDPWCEGEVPFKWSVFVLNHTILDKNIDHERILLITSSLFSK
jgi:hypothetical protein